jgi:prepilin-type processing-associated H-X9-DG protein
VPTPAGVTGPYANYAEISATKGQFFKMEQWGRRGQGKALVMDSNGFNVVASGSWLKAHELAGSSTPAQTQPGSMGIDYPATALTGSYVNIDAARHAAPTANRQKIMQSRGTNCLFVDGHAAPVTPREAWIAMWGAGTDMTQ